MLRLQEGISSQENMHAWFSQMQTSDFALAKTGILSEMDPKFESCNLERKELLLSFAVKDWELNPEGGLHGGMIMTAFDLSFGLLCHYFSKQKAICTVNLSTNFLKPIPPSGNVVYRIKAVSTGKTIVSMTGEAMFEDVLAATASATFMILNNQLDIEI